MKISLQTKISIVLLCLAPIMLINILSLNVDFLLNHSYTCCCFGSWCLRHSKEDVVSDHEDTDCVDDYDDDDDQST